MKLNAATSAARLGGLKLPLAIALTCSALAAQAASDKASWVPTKTEAFLPRLLSTQNNENVFTTHAVATPMAAGKKRSVLLTLDLRNQSQLEEFLTALYTPGHPSYRQFLTPEQFAQNYAPTQSDVDEVVEYLTSEGFINIVVSPNRTMITAEGTTAAISQAFNTTLKSFTYQGRTVFANDKPAQVPAYLGKRVNAVLGLQNAVSYHPLHTEWRTDLTPKAFKTLATNAVSQVSHIPAEFPVIYGNTKTPAASSTVVGIISAGKMTGTLDNFADFLSHNQNLPQLVPTIIHTDNFNQNTDDNDEEDGEIEWALDSQLIYGTAGGVKDLVFYSASSLGLGQIALAFNHAVTENVAKIVNVSLGLCEDDARASGSQAIDDAIFKQAVAQGMTFSVSSGDTGPYNCAFDAYGNVGVAKTIKQKKTYDVSEPASSPYVVALGGTSLYTTSTGDYFGQAVWNSGITKTSDGKSERIWSTGGGFSMNQPAPSWQTAAIIGTKNTTRGLPDLVFNADRKSGTIIYANGETYLIGGTSVAAPIFAGLWARLESANGNKLGFANPLLYATIPSNPSSIIPVSSTSINGNDINFTGWSEVFPGMKATKKIWDPATGFGSLNVDAFNSVISSGIPSR